MPDRVMGATTRRRRLSDTDTERRALDAAVDIVAQHGLTVSLEHLSLEEIIRRAGVSRSSVYRRWPHRHLFFNDLLVEIARGHELAFDLPGIERAVTAVIREHAHRAQTLQGRHTLVVELLRASVEVDFAALYRSASHRTYLGVRATFVSLPDGPTRMAVGQALAEREAELHRVRSGLYARVAEVFGYRLKPPLTPPTGFDLISHCAAAALTGLLVAVEATPSLTDERLTLRAFDSELETTWSRPAYAVTAVILAHLEPDPHAVVDPEHLRGLPGMLSALTAATPPPTAPAPRA